MKLTGMNEWISLTANIAVLIGIIFLAVELQQSNRIATSSMEFELRDNFTSINELALGNREFAELAVKLSDPHPELDKLEQARSTAFVARLGNIWGAVEQAYDQGMIPKETFLSFVRDDIRQAVNSWPGLIPYFRDSLVVFPELADSSTFTFIRQFIEEYEAGSP